MCLAGSETFTPRELRDDRDPISRERNAFSRMKLSTSLSHVNVNFVRGINRKRVIHDSSIRRRR